MSKTYETVIRNLREDAPEVAKQLIELIRTEEGKVKLDAIKFHLQYVASKDAQQVPEKHYSEYPLDVQIDLFKKKVAKLEEERMRRLESIPVTAKEGDVAR